MDSDDDYQSFSPPKDPSPPHHFRRLKRLKKSNPNTSNASLPELIGDPLLFSTVDFAELEALENDSEPQKFSEVNSIEEASLSQESLSQGSENETESVSAVKASNAMRVLEFDAEVTGRVPENGKLIGEDSENFEPEKIDEETIGQDFGSGGEVLKAKRVLEFDAEVTGRVHENEKPIGEGSESFELEKSLKEGTVQEGLLEEKENKKKKKKREKSHSGEELKTSNKRREEKERKAYLKELHAESQRLLRETRDASFKPIQVVQKPISSVLEKIRKRKLEIAKSIFVKDSPHGSEGNIKPSERQMDLDASNEEGAEENVTIIVDKETVSPSVNRQSLSASDMDIDADKQRVHESEQNQALANEEPTPVFRAPVDDTQDLFDDSELNGATAAQNDDEQLNSPLEEDFAPSLLSMNLKFDSAPMEDSSSEEEDNNKENVNPRPREIGDGSSSPKGDPVKDFIDDEAEEEDDSDNDLLRFQENETADDIDDFEELNDMIATECEERPTDKERRDELHQKWLEQQDAAGTDNLMQRLKCSKALRDTFLTDNEVETDEDDDDEFDVKAGEDSLPQKPSRVNIKKAKQIILDLFSEKEDTYLSDDDDGTLRRHAQCFIRKEEQATLVSPDDDASSREVFGLIKKMNIASDNKKKPKALSSFDSVLKGGNRDHSSKSSFLGRVSNHPLPSSHKPGSATVRSFIFGRDDSNSRSSMSMSEDSSDTVSRPARNVTAKYSNSQQSRGKTESRDSGAERFSLLEILKRSSSSQSQACNQDSAVDLTKSMFGFRVPKKTPKIEGRS